MPGTSGLFTLIYSAIKFAPLAPCLRPPRWQGLCSQSAHLWAISDFLPRFEARGPRDGSSYVANPPNCGPFLIFSLALKLAGPEMAAVM